jgi:predicted metal-binding membrane protein
VRIVALVGMFLVVWSAASLLLTRLRWFRPRLPLSERLAPYATPRHERWVDDVERWLENPDR